MANLGNPSRELIDIVLHGIISEELLRRKSGGDDNSLGQEFSKSSLEGNLKRVSVEESEEILELAETGSEVVDDNILVTVISIPPLERGWGEISVGTHLEGSFCLASS